MSTLHLKQKGDLGQIQFSASSFSQKNRMIIIILLHKKFGSSNWATINYTYGILACGRDLFSLWLRNSQRTEHTPDNSSKEINPGSVSSVSGGPSLKLLILYMLVQQQ